MHDFFQPFVSFPPIYVFRGGLHHNIPTSHKEYVQKNMTGLPSYSTIPNCFSIDPIGKMHPGRNLLGPPGLHLMTLLPISFTQIPSNPVMASLVTRASPGNLPGKSSAPAAADNIRTRRNIRVYPAFARFASSCFATTADLLLLS
jgi:hypothetical protein